MADHIPRRGYLGLVCLVAFVAGCRPLAPDALVVATSWLAADRKRIESEFAAWLERNADASPPGPVRIDWLILAPGDDLEKLAARRRPPDVLLGGPSRCYERLAGANRLCPLPIQGSPDWAVARRSVVHLLVASNNASEVAAPRDGVRVTFDDPRHDLISRAWAEQQLAGDGFRDGYARLVQNAAGGRRIGRQAGSAAAAVERGEAEIAIGASSSNLNAPDARAMPWPEGVAIVANGSDRDQALAFLKFLATTKRAMPRPERVTKDSADLLSELLGATLVDAQDELWDAWKALERAGVPAGQLRWMTEPPPWPPASIARILSRHGEQAMAMVETLAGQLAPDPSTRAWLISSWLSPSRPIDRQVLEELTGAADGHLVRQSTFREWLRAEWTAWARQRYRRVLRSLDEVRP